MFDRSPAWRIFCTRSRAEKRVEESLERRAVEVFLPKCAEVHQWKDRKKQVILPLFPGYIFAHVNERERLDVLTVDGVVRTLTMDGQLCALSQDEIEQLRILQQDPYRVEAVAISQIPEKGTHVTINRGALSGLSGEVRNHRGLTHVVIVVEAIKQAVRVIVPAEWIEETKASDYLYIRTYRQ
ncbi:MAG TPA: UpxY family transcription antiterminator [Rhodothermales bacterium]|nr:UpxY family transcription antiterminator [Rhodothermales bacterium]